ncbi:hypothetical protein HDU87_003247 [Geranomyces variabilis]|uniref:EF-hand domain-containing protein n=1 Tax=Geranomyces variabilis TaxID=109894 RepID=A0AAD5TL69_9FUNG|nr:hypothetical protein HDU87_003247 [Geranomyces variabilis]
MVDPRAPPLHPPPSVPSAVPSPTVPPPPRATPSNLRVATVPGGGTAAVSNAGSSPPQYSPPSHSGSPAASAAAVADALQPPAGDDDFDWLGVDYAGAPAPAAEDEVQEDEAEGLFGLRCCHVPPWARFLVYMLVGLAVPALPLLISYLVLHRPNDPNIFSDISVSDTLTLSTEIARWAFWLASVWCAWLIMWYFLDVLPYILIVVLSKLFGGYSEKARSRLEYMVAVKIYLTIASWTVLYTVSYALLFNQMNQVDYWQTIFHVIVTSMVWSLCLLVHKLLLQVIAVKFHRIAYKDRIVESKKNMRILESLKRYAKSQQRTTSEFFFIPADSPEHGGGRSILSPRFPSPTRLTPTRLSRQSTPILQSPPPEPPPAPILEPPVVAATDTGEQVMSSSNLKRATGKHHHRHHHRHRLHNSPENEATPAPASDLPRAQHQPPPPTTKHSHKFWRSFLKRRAKKTAESRDDLDMDDYGGTAGDDGSSSSSSGGGDTSDSDSERAATVVPPKPQNLPVPLDKNRSDDFDDDDDEREDKITKSASLYPDETIPSIAGVLTTGSPSRRSTMNRGTASETALQQRYPTISRHPRPPSITGTPGNDPPQHHHHHRTRTSSATPSSSGLRSRSSVLRPAARSRRTSATSRENEGDPASLLENQNDNSNAGGGSGGSSSALLETTTTIRAPVSGLNDMSGRAYMRELQRMDISTHVQASKLAKKIFVGLGGNEKGFLTLDDFMRCFPNTFHAAEAFSVLDQDGNGSITRKEVKECVIGIYRERRGLYRAMRDLSQALGKLDSFFFFVDGFVTFCIALPIFGIALTAMLPFTSFILALSFIFGTAARTAFESLLFLFVTHPYDAGDRVVIDAQNLLVEEVGVLTTVFKRMDGQLIYAPNTLVSQKLITNLRRSSDQSEAIEVQIDFNTPEDRIRLLRERLVEFVKSEPREFVGTCDVHIADIENVNKVKLNVILKHKGNWQDGSKRWGRRTMFMYALKHHLSELGIKYLTPPQHKIDGPPAAGGPTAPTAAIVPLVTVEHSNSAPRSAAGGSGGGESDRLAQSVAIAQQTFAGASMF